MSRSEEERRQRKDLRARPLHAAGKLPSKAVFVRWRVEDEAEIERGQALIELAAE